MLLSCAGSVAAALPGPAERDCERLFDASSPSLYEFVKTRKSVDFDMYHGKRIGLIEYRVLDVFNEDSPAENNSLYRGLNRLHINTRERSLRQQMIVHPGEILNADIVRENERLLRGRDYLLDAMILPARVCTDSIDLLVVVRDVWTFYPRASASRSGGENSSGLGITEQNLFGTGQHLSISYFDEDDRSGYGVSYRVPEFFYPHLDLSVDYYDNSDGHQVSASLVKPFFELDSRWSAGAYHSDITLDQTIKRDDTVINEYQQSYRNSELFVGWSPGRQNGAVHRWRTGLTETHHRFSPTNLPSQPPQDVALRYPWVSWQFLEDRYWTTSNISRSHRQEDILLGLQSHIRLGYSDQGEDRAYDAAVFSTTVNHTASVGPHHLLRSSAGLRGHYDLDNQRAVSNFYDMGFRYYNFVDSNNRWFARLLFRATHNARDDELLSGGGGDSLRGYPSNIQRGNRQWLFSVERRHFTDIHLLNLVWLGGAAYVDSGRTWDSERRYPGGDDRVLSNVGLGLRLNPSKFRVDQVGHIDIAWPLNSGDNIDNYQIILRGSVDF